MVGKRGLDSSGSGKGPVAGTCEHNEPSGSIKCEEFFTTWVTISFSWRTLLHGVARSLARLLACLLGCFNLRRHTA